MGLESIELLVSVEEFFKIEISEQEACRINTIKDLTDCIENKIKFKKSGGSIQNHVSKIFQKAWIELGFSILHMYEPINSILTAKELDKLWNYIKKHHQIKLPQIKAKASKNASLIHGSNLNQLIDWTIALNYISLIHPKQIHSLYEIECVTSGILIQQFNVAFSSLHPNAHIKNNLGLD